MSLYLIKNQTGDFLGEDDIGLYQMIIDESETGASVP